MDEPETDEPGNNEPETDMPETDEPGNDEPGNDEPRSDEPRSDEPDGGPGHGGGLSWLQVAVLGFALAFLGFAVGLFVSRDRPPGEGSVDVGFYQDMISHHEQGLEIATYTVANAADPVVRSFADEVHLFQSYEIGLMDRTLQDWGFSRADRPETAMAWMGMPLPVDQMPGLATPEQMDELRDARGADADALFLELMATHHAGGLHMAQYAAANADDADVRELAARMAHNQSVEINEYAQTAERLGLPVEIERVPVPGEPAS